MNRTMNSNNPAKNSGFTLAEVLIAIGILAIGMTMIAAVFPAALKLTENSTNDSLGTVICENGIALTKSKLASTSISLPSSGDLQIIADDNIESEATSPQQSNCYAWDTANGGDYPFAKDELSYPYGTSTGVKFGIATLGRTIDSNSQQIICTSYRKKDTSNDVVWDKITVTDIGTNSDDITEIKLNNPSLACGGIPVGSPVLFEINGEFGIVKACREDSGNYIATLDRKLNTETGDIDTANPNSFILVEGDSGNLNNKCERKSPAMATMVIRTSLQ